MGSNVLWSVRGYVTCVLCSGALWWRRSVWRSWSKRTWLILWRETNFLKKTLFHCRGYVKTTTVNNYNRVFFKKVSCCSLADTENVVHCLKADFWGAETFSLFNCTVVLCVLKGWNRLCRFWDWPHGQRGSSSNASMRWPKTPQWCSLCNFLTYFIMSYMTFCLTAFPPECIFIFILLENASTDCTTQICWNCHPNFSYRLMSTISFK